MAFLFKTSKLRPYKACKSLADTPISQKLANILTGLAYLQGAPICTTEIHSAESGWLVGTTGGLSCHSQNELLNVVTH